MSVMCVCVGEACSSAGAEADDGGGDEAGAGGAGGYEGGAREITHAQQQEVRYTIPCYWLSWLMLY